MSAGFGESAHARRRQAAFGRGRGLVWAGVLALLLWAGAAAAAADGVTGSLTVFNPYPSAFVAYAANVPSSNPQVVGTSSLPADWTVSSAR